MLWDEEFIGTNSSRIRYYGKSLAEVVENEVGHIRDCWLHMINP